MPDRPAVPTSEETGYDPAALEAENTKLWRVLYDIAEGRWNTPSRVLDTPTNLSAREYARAAIRGAVQ